MKTKSNEQFKIRERKSVLLTTYLNLGAYYRLHVKYESVIYVFGCVDVCSSVSWLIFHFSFLIVILI